MSAQLAARRTPRCAFRPEHPSSLAELRSKAGWAGFLLRKARHGVSQRINRRSLSCCRSFVNEGRTGRAGAKPFRNVAQFLESNVPGQVLCSEKEGSRRRFCIPTRLPGVPCASLSFCFTVFLEIFFL